MPKKRNPSGYGLPKALTRKQFKVKGEAKALLPIEAAEKKNAAASGVRAALARMEAELQMSLSRVPRYLRVARSYEELKRLQPFLSMLMRARLGLQAWEGQFDARSPEGQSVQAALKAVEARLMHVLDLPSPDGIGAMMETLTSELKGARKSPGEEGPRIPAAEGVHWRDQRIVFASGLSCMIAEQRTPKGALMDGSRPVVRFSTGDWKSFYDRVSARVERQLAGPELIIAFTAPKDHFTLPKSAADVRAREPLLRGLFTADRQLSQLEFALGHVDVQKAVIRPAMRHIFSIRERIEAAQARVMGDASRPEMVRMLELSFGEDWEFKLGAQESKERPKK